MGSSAAGGCPSERGGGLTLREILGLLFRGQPEEPLDRALYA